MKFDEFIKSSALSDLQTSTVFCTPCLPKDALFKAILTYAKNIKINQAIILVDEGGFFSAGEEGLVITNDKIILSPKFGNKVIPFSNIDSIKIQNKVLVINEEIVGVFEKSDISPFNYLGSKLSDYFKFLNNPCFDKESETVLKDSKLDEIQGLISNFQNRELYDSFGFISKEHLSEEEYRFVRFRCGLAKNEDILALVWLDFVDAKDQFFCITNDAIYSTRSDVKILFKDLKELSVVDIYQEKVFMVVKLSNDLTFPVSGVYLNKDNTQKKPYTHLLLSELIELLNKW